MWIVGLVVIASLAIGMWAFSPTEVTVTGIGKVSVPATIASFNVTLTAAKDNPDEALREVQARVDTLKRSLAEVRIGSEDITETPVTVTPAAAVVANAKGYQAMSTLTVKTGNPTLVGELVVKMYQSGATLVSQPTVGVDDLEKLESQALNEALVNARTNLRDTVGFRPIKKRVAIQQASSGNTAAATKVIEDNKGAFEVTKAVSVTYRVW